MALFWLLVVTGIVLAIQAALFARFGLKKVQYRRYFSKRALHEGDEVMLIEIISNHKPLPVPWVRAESRVSHYLQFGARSSDESSEEQYHSSVFFMAPYKQITRKHNITCKKRGVYSAASVALTSGDIFGFGISTLQLSVNMQPLLVYPKLIGTDGLFIPGSRMMGDVLVRRWIVDDPFMHSGLRDYMPGDSQRDVHWAATARMGSLQVKVRDHTADPRLLVFLNIQPSEGLWGEIDERGESLIEHAISLCASICIEALDAGVEAGFGCNGMYKGEEHLGTDVFLAPARSPAQADALLTLMAHIVVRRRVNFHTYLAQYTVTGMDILVVTSYLDEFIDAQIARLRAMGNAVTVHELIKYTSEGGLAA